MKPLDVIRRAAASIADQVAALGGRGRGGGTRLLAQVRAAVSGKTVAAEQRAIQRALKTGRPPAKQSAAVAQAGTRAALARKLREARTVHVGTVTVSYSSGRGRRAEGRRDIGDVSVDANLRGYLRDAADRLDRGDQTGAMERISAGLMDAYGAESLDIDDYVNGLEFN